MIRVPSHPTTMGELLGPHNMRCHANDHRLLRWNIKRQHAFPPALVSFLLLQKKCSHARGGYVVTYIHAAGFGTHLTFADVAVLRRGLPTVQCNACSC